MVGQAICLYLDLHGARLISARDAELAHPGARAATSVGRLATTTRTADVSYAGHFFASMGRKVGKDRVAAARVVEGRGESLAICE